MKSKLRTEAYPWFVMVLNDPDPKRDQFRAVVIFCKTPWKKFEEDEKPGFESNTWNISKWERSSWEEVKRWI
ncbi:MAG: hypothetical protein ACWA44_02770 [Thiotrichales bacterium]